MAIYDFFLSRNNAASTPTNYIGHVGRLFYDGANGVIKLSDGVTPGGLSIPYTIASTSTIGGIKAGPGVAINSEGQLLIDSAGLTFTFGDLQGTVGTYAAGNPDAGEDYALLNSINLNEDIVIASNGTGVVKILGDFSVRATDGDIDDELLREPVFRVNAEGQIRMLVPLADSNEGALNIIGGLDGVYQVPVNSGVMLHITGQPGTPSRIYNDAQNSFSAFVARRYNGTAAAPTAVLADEEIMRISGTAHNGTIIPGTGNQRIVYKALGNQTLTSQGGYMEFWTTPLNSTTLAKVATVNSLGITLESGTIFAGNVTIGAGNTLDVTGATVTGLTLGGFNPADIAGTMTGSAITATVTSSSLTSVGTLSNLRVTNTVTATTFVGNLTGVATTSTTSTYAQTVTTAAQPTITSVGTLTNLSVSGTVSATTGTFTRLSGKWIRNVRDAGTITAGGTLTIDFSTDAVVYCLWGDGMTLAYQNFTAGSIVKIIATKASGTGVDAISLDGVTAARVSNGLTTTPNAAADTTVFIEATCVGTTIGSVYIKL